MIKGAKPVKTVALVWQVEEVESCVFGQAEAVISALNSMGLAVFAFWPVGSVKRGLSQLFCEKMNYAVDGGAKSSYWLDQFSNNEPACPRIIP
jgi:hypothetical protein